MGTTRIMVSSKRLHSFKYVIFCAISYHLYNFKNVKNTHGGVLLLVKLQAKSQMVQMVPNRASHHNTKYA